MDDSADSNSLHETPAAAPSNPVLMDIPAGERRRQPLRFTWAMDAEGRFSFGSDEFTRLIGAQTAAAFGRIWSEVNDALALDPENLLAQAVATRETFSNILLEWPTDGRSATLQRYAVRCRDRSDAGAGAWVTVSRRDFRSTAGHRKRGRACQCRAVPACQR